MTKKIPENECSDRWFNWKRLGYYCSADGERATKKKCRKCVEAFEEDMHFSHF